MDEVNSTPSWQQSSMGPGDDEKYAQAQCLGKLYLPLSLKYMITSPLLNFIYAHISYRRQKTRFTSQQLDK
jgi:hypothetical protein